MVKWIKADDLLRLVSILVSVSLKSERLVQIPVKSERSRHVESDAVGSSVHKLPQTATHRKRVVRTGSPRNNLVGTTKWEFRLVVANSKFLEQSKTEQQLFRCGHVSLWASAAPRPNLLCGLIWQAVDQVIVFDLLKHQRLKDQTQCDLLDCYLNSAKLISQQSQRLLKTTPPTNKNIGGLPFDFRVQTSLHCESLLESAKVDFVVIHFRLLSFLNDYADEC